MSELTRREFLGASLLGAGAVASGVLPSPAAAAEVKRTAAKSAVDRVMLGKTGVKASFLAQGTGMHGGGRASDHTRMGQKKFTELVMRGFDQGMNFMDMADLYGTHPYTKNALKDVPRDKYTVLTKIWPRSASWNEASGGAKAEVERFCKELGTDHLDICLIHCMTSEKWPDEFKRVRDELNELKEKKTVRAVGVSCHNFEAMKVASELPWTDVLLARINYKGVKMDGPPEDVAKVLLTARGNGKAVIGMKVFGEGSLIEPEQMDASLQYVINNKLVDAMTIGMLKPEEVDENIKRITKWVKA